MKTVQLQLFLLLLTLNLFGQAPDSILTGSYLNSLPNKNFTLYDYSIVKPLGFNTVIQRAVVSIPEINQVSNFDSLKYFPYIFALNDSVIDAVSHPSNADWVYYFSNALYSRWIPGENIIPYLSTEIGLKQKFGPTLRDGVSTGTDTVNINTIFIDGPNHSQYKNYVYTNKYLTNDLIYYTAVFRLKKIQNTGPGDEVCKVQAVAKRGADSTILAEKVITKSDLGSEYKEISLDYNYGVLQEAARGRGDLQLPPTTLLPGIEVEDSYLSEGTRIQLRVVWLGNAEIALKDVEVFDQKIWKYFFIENQANRDSRITQYLSKFAGLQPNLKYFFTLDEPHSLDSYHPIKILQTVLDSLGSPVALLTHFYPGWNNTRESDNSLGSWYKYVNPRKLSYWYFPFDTSEESANGLYFYGHTLKAAAELDPHFWATVQTWGYKDSQGVYHTYRSPSPAEVSAQSLYALSFGAKGIFYEPFYSYGSWRGSESDGEPTIVEGIVDHNFNPRDIYYKILELNSRMRGDLGKNLVRMKHSDFVRITNEYGRDTTTTSSIGLMPGDPAFKYTFHAGILTDTLNPSYLNFLLLNLHVNNSRMVGTIIRKPLEYSNYRFQSVDPAGLMDSTITGNDTLFITLSAGDGGLFRLSPALREGGSIWASDTIKISTILNDYLRVMGGSRLVVEDNIIYEVNDTLEFRDSSGVENSGYINVGENGEIIQPNWNKALFRGRQGNNPFLYWSKNTTTTALSGYRIYRKNGNSAWQLTGTTSGCTFRDSTVTILTPGHPSGSDEYYKVVPFNQRGVEGNSTNTVSYNIVGELLEKKGQNSVQLHTFRVEQNYPNPFNPVTVVEYEIPTDGIVVAEPYDITGEKVMDIMNGERSAGIHRITIDGNRLSNGVYLFRLKFGNYTSLKKIILLK